MIAVLLLSLVTAGPPGPRGIQYVYVPEDTASQSGVVLVDHTENYGCTSAGALTNPDDDGDVVQFGKPDASSKSAAWSVSVPTQDVWKALEAQHPDASTSYATYMEATIMGTVGSVSMFALFVFVVWGIEACYLSCISSPVTADMNIKTG